MRVKNRTDEIDFVARDSCVVCGSEIDVGICQTEEYGGLSVCFECYSSPRLGEWLKNFKGWGVEELADRWGMKYKDDGEEVYEVISNLIGKTLNGDGGVEKVKELANDVRSYCLSLARLHETRGGDEFFFWKTFSEMKEDYFVLKMFHSVARHAWT